MEIENIPNTKGFRLKDRFKYTNLKRDFLQREIDYFRNFNNQNFAKKNQNWQKFKKSSFDQNEDIFVKKLKRGKHNVQRRKPEIVKRRKEVVKAEEDKTFKIEDFEKNRKQYDEETVKLFLKAKQEKGRFLSEEYFRGFKKMENQVYLYKQSMRKYC